MFQIVDPVRPHFEKMVMSIFPKNAKKKGFQNWKPFMVDAGSITWSASHLRREPQK